MDPSSGEGARGTTVLGRTADGYLDVAASLGARGLNVPNFLWTRMTRDQKWRVNRAFLDAGIRRGDAFRLVTPPFAPYLTNLYGMEISYMLSRGYRRVQRDGVWWLVR